MVIGFYYVWSIVVDYKSKSFSVISKLSQLGGLLAALIIAFIMVSDPYNEVYTFQKYSNRGAKSVLDTTGKTSSGTDWNYATQWSFHPKEIISFIYPYFYGLQNFPSRDLKSAAYWGYMPFTQSTHYLGLIALILASLGPLLRKPDKISLFFWITTFNFNNRLWLHISHTIQAFFEVFPFFSKFRIPSMIYALLPVTISILASRGFDVLLDREYDKYTFQKVLYVAGSITMLSLFFLIFPILWLIFIIQKMVGIMLLYKEN